MSRCPAQQSALLTEFMGDLAALPEAGFVVATAEPDPATLSIVTRVGDLGCTPLDLISFAQVLLERASAGLQLRAKVPEVRTMLFAVEQARAALHHGANGCTAQ